MLVDGYLAFRIVHHPPSMTRLREYLSRVQDASRIERRLDAFHERDHVTGELDRQIRGLREADTVLAADRSFERNDALEELSLRLSRSFQFISVALVDHEIDMDVAVARMSERRDTQVILTRQITNRIEQLRNTSTRYDDIVIDLQQSRRAQGE